MRPSSWSLRSVAYSAWNGRSARRRRAPRERREAEGEHARTGTHGEFQGRIRKCRRARLNAAFTRLVDVRRRENRSGAASGGRRATIASPQAMRPAAISATHATSSRCSCAQQARGERLRRVAGRRSRSRPARATGPPSSSAVTKCTLAPCIASPASSARRACEGRGYFGSRDGWILIDAPGPRREHGGIEDAHEAGEHDQVGRRAAMRANRSASKLARSA